MFEKKQNTVGSKRKDFIGALSKEKLKVLNMFPCPQK